MSATDKAIDQLNELIETCCDGEQGFKLAAESMKDANLSSTFLKYAGERSTFASQLKTEVARLGGTPAEAGTFAAKAHRGWINLRSKLGDGQEAIVAECERGEDAAVAAYKETLALPLPAPTHELVNKQQIIVQRAHDHLRALKTAGV